MNAWSHLPNAHHIDRVLESLKSHPEIWDAAFSAAFSAASDAAFSAAFSAARGAASDAARDAASDAAWDAIWLAARNAARLAIWGAARSATWNATAALIAYDDASKYLEMSSGHLRIWAILSEDPAAVLLIPAVIAFERIRELESV
jgi:hypothetical protein